MVINYFDIVGIAILPDETDAPLVVYADAVPAGAISLQGFQPVGGRHPQVAQIFRLVEND